MGPGSAANQSAAQLLHKRILLRDLLQFCRRKFSHSNTFVHILKHKYTDSSLSLKGLYGPDRALGQYLSTFCLSDRFYLFFAQMSRVRIPGGEPEEDDLGINHVVLPDGLHVANYCPVIEEEILQEDLGRSYRHAVCHSLCVLAASRVYTNNLIGSHYCSCGKPL